MSNPMNYARACELLAESEASAAQLRAELAASENRVQALRREWADTGEACGAWRNRAEAAESEVARLTECNEELVAALKMPCPGVHSGEPSLRELKWNELRDAALSKNRGTR